MSIRHGFARRNTDHPVYTCWLNMRSRCHNPKNTCFSYYGGRGITVCRRWRNSFENFFADMGLPPTPGLTLERRNNDKGYCKRNCRWDTRLTQANNTRKNVYLTLKGTRLTLAQWARKLNLLGHTIYRRYCQGLSPADILKPVAPHLKVVAASHGIPYDWFHDKVKDRGLSIDDAVALFAVKPDGRVDSGRRKAA